MFAMSSSSEIIFLLPRKNLIIVIDLKEEKERSEVIHDFDFYLMGEFSPLSTLYFAESKLLSILEVKKMEGSPCFYQIKFTYFKTPLKTIKEVSTQ